MRHQLRKAVALILFSFISCSIFSQWTQTAGPQGINVDVFYQKGSALFSGTNAKGVFKSTDHGVTWTAANAGIENRSVFSLTSDSIYLYAGTDNGVYRSSNNGVTWSASGLTGNFIQSFQKANGYMFAGTTAFGVFKSNDFGASWTDANGGALGSSSVNAMAFSGTNLIASADNLIFYSNDNGASWFYPLSSPFTFTYTPSFYVQGDSVLLNAGFNVFRSFDNGESWGPPITVDDEINMSGLFKVGKKIYGGGATGIFYTKNFGATWHAVASNGMRFGNRFSHHFYKSGNNFLIAYDEIGVGYSSDKGLNWQYTLSGFPPASNIDNALLASGSVLLSGTHSDGLYKSSNNGNTWTKIGTPNPLDTLSNGIIFSVYRSGSLILAGTCGYGLYRSADNGSTWTHITSGIPSDETGFACIESITKCGSNLLIATILGVYYSSDNGVTWNDTNISGEGFVAMGVGANGTTGCAVVNSFTGGNKIWKSTNSGVTWTTVFTSFSEDFLCVASDGVNHFYVGTFSSNYVSANNGTTWNSFGPGIPFGTGSFALAAKDSIVFSGNNTGVYFSDDRALTFTEVNEGLDPEPNIAAQGLTISNTYVFAGFFQNAVCKRPLTDFGIGVREAALTDKPEIKVFPNPASDQSILSYTLSGAADVSITIFDMNGKIATLDFYENSDAGPHNYLINTAEMSAGNYTISLRVGDKSETVILSVVK